MEPYINGFIADFCGSGSWQPGNLEIHHINIGQADSTLIVGPTGRSLLFDAGESNWNSSAKARIIGPYIEGVLGCKALDYVVISHFHVDHLGYVGYGGLWHLVETQGFTMGTTLVRDYNTYLGDISGTFTNWKTYLEGAGQAKLHPILAIEGTSQINLGAGVGFSIVALDGNGAILAGDFHGDASPPSENDYSIGAVLSYGNFDEWIGGDLGGQYEIGGFGYTYHDIELSVAPEVGDVDVYKVNHHASSHSSSDTFINQLDPEVSIVSVGNGNTYGHPAQSIMDRLLATSTVYMTERGDTNTNIGAAIVAGNIVIKTSNGLTYTVNGTAFSATEPLRIDSDGDGYFAEVDPSDINSTLMPAPNGGCGSIYQTCSASSVSCQATAGQVLINEVLPSPSNNGTEWVELYNTTASSVNIGYCYIDDVAAGGSAVYQIPASTLIPAHGFWTLDRTSYFNNAGDDVRFLKQDASTVLDSYSYGNTGYDLSRYRLPDGGAWAGLPTASITKGQSNTIPFYPIVLSSVRTDASPTDSNSVNFTLTFSKAVTGVDKSAPFNDFALTTTGVAGAYLSAVNGSGTIYTITVNTGSGDGTIRLDVVDGDSIKDENNHPLGGLGGGNGNFSSGGTYTVVKSTFADVPFTHMFWKYIEAFYQSGITTGCSQSPKKYCPLNNVTRGEMAVFVERAMGNYAPAPNPTGMFTDLPYPGLEFFTPFIEEFYNDGITTGCTMNPLKYCPQNYVTRGEMAVFIERALGNFNPDPSPTGMFADVPYPGQPASFQAFIEAFYNDGITTGCAVNPLKYCPQNKVTRQEMAVFIVRAFGIPLP
ncbi:MAG: lamin tail domain-containing protein [Chloroflexota bacterium]